MRVRLLEGLGVSSLQDPQEGSHGRYWDGKAPRHCLVYPLAFSSWGEGERGGTGGGT